MKNCNGLIALAIGVVVGYFAAPAASQILPPPNSSDEVVCRRLTVQGLNGASVKIGSSRDGTFIALNSPANDPYANFCLFITPRGVPAVQVIDENGRQRVVTAKQLIDLSRSAGIGESSAGIGAIK